MSATPLRARAALALTTAALAFIAAPFARAAVDRGQTLTYTVLRDGDPVGTHTIAIDGGPDDGRIAIKTDVVVKFAFVPVYRFEQTSHEEWRQGRLVSLKSVTNDDGSHHDLSVQGTAGGLEVRDGGTSATIPGALLPASLWNPALVGASHLLNTIDGHAMTVTVTDKGMDTVTVHGLPRPAHHYAVTGDLQRELWYDGRGTLVRVRFAAKDSSDINYVLK